MKALPGAADDVLRDLYYTLGIDPDAREQDIKKAFRRVALECHPDRNWENPEAEERFKQANYAYSILGDPDKRRRYDLYREFHSRSVRWGFVPPHSPIIDRAVENFFLNASIPGFSEGVPWRSSAFSRLNVIFSFSAASFQFMRRFFHALRDQEALRIPLEFTFSSPLLGRSLFARRSEADTSPSLSDDESGDTEWTLLLSGEEARNGTSLMLSFPLDSGWEKVRLRVPAGVRNGVRLRVRNKGAQIGEQAPQRGDLYLKIRVNGLAFSTV